jgi:hypothetical protein
MSNDRGKIRPHILAGNFKFPQIRAVLAKGFENKFHISQSDEALGERNLLRECIPATAVESTAMKSDSSGPVAASNCMKFDVF